MSATMENQTRAATETYTDSEAEPVRLLILCEGDPEGARAFSGSARSLFQALERRGIVHHKANVASSIHVFSRGNRWIRLFRKFDKFHLEARYRWSNFTFRRNSARARQVARAHPGYNACLMYGTHNFGRLEVPTYCYFDATAAQVYAARAWEFSHFSEAAARRIIGLQKSVFDQCTGIFPRSRWAADSVTNDYGISPGKICVANAGPNYYADPLPHGPYARQTILFIGREFERKGGPLILEAFRRTRKALPDARLVIIGCTPDIREDGVEIVGIIKKDAPGGLDRLLKYYSEASLFCIMSLYEPFGIVVIEAQNSYLPCVVPARYAFTETVVDGVTGRHVAEYDPSLLANTFIEMLSDPARLEQMGKAGHDYVRANYTWDEAARRIHERIQADLQTRRSRGAGAGGPT